MSKITHKLEDSICLSTKARILLCTINCSGSLTKPVIWYSLTKMWLDAASLQNFTARMASHLWSQIPYQITKAAAEACDQTASCCTLRPSVTTCYLKQPCSIWDGISSKGLNSIIDDDCFKWQLNPYMLLNTPTYFHTFNCYRPVTNQHPDNPKCPKDLGSDLNTRLCASNNARRMLS